MRFSLDRWAAWAPGIVDQASWLAWLASPSAVTLEDTPALSEMPAMMRRRVERLGRMALQTAYWGIGDTTSCSIVFASRYGDVSRSVELLRYLAANEPLSPTSFSMSVHNAIGALFSIARGDTSAHAAIAAGSETVEAAFTEALGLLSDGAEAVLVVYYEEPLPEPHTKFSEQQDFPRAWACRLRRSETAGITLRARTSTCATASHDANSIPTDLAALRFLLSQDTHYDHLAGSRTWHWQRHV